MASSTENEAKTPCGSVEPTYSPKGRPSPRDHLQRWWLLRLEPDEWERDTAFRRLRDRRVDFCSRRLSHQFPGSPTDPQVPDMRKAEVEPKARAGHGPRALGRKFKR